MELSPRTSLADWPYEGYPEQFAGRPVELGIRKRIGRKQLATLTCQGLDDQAADDLVAVVVPSERLGVSLWGESGDAEMVEVIFQVDPETAIVSVSNQCT